MLKTNTARSTRSKSFSSDRGDKKFSDKKRGDKPFKSEFKKDDKKSFSSPRNTFKDSTKSYNKPERSGEKREYKKSDSFKSDRPSYTRSGSSSRFSSRGSDRVSSSFAPRSRFGGGGNRGGGRKNSVFSDITKFINKSTQDNKNYTEEVYIPENSFASLKIEESLKKNIFAGGYINPTLIQDKSIPAILAGRDVVGIANTGTGKTASFLIPLTDKALKNSNEKFIILAPTRELAVQIDEEFKKLKKGLKLWSVCAVGGVPIYRQMKDFKYEFNFLIGTPGRIKDLIERGVINLKEFQTIVLDESDRMLDMGFVEDMKFLMKGMQKPHQTIFFSATVSPAVDKIIKEFLVDPVSISVKTRDTAESIDQDIVDVKGKDKLKVLHELLLESSIERAIIFVKTKSGVDKLYRNLKELGHSIESIHGDKRPRERNFSLKSFKDGNVNTLIATDVAARGLDISDISHVINYDLPSTYEDYIHRIGRTGRAGKTGKALTFME